MIILQLSGGLGNQMFQYAFGRAISKRLGVELVLDLSDPTLQIHNGYELRRTFNIQARAATKSDIKTVLGLFRHNNVKRVIRKLGLSQFFPMSYLIETHFNFMPQTLKISDNTYLSGYWQSEKYFKEVIDIIFEDFTFFLPMSEMNQSLSADIIDEKETAISLHVRRGDFVNNLEFNKVHGNLSQEYYISAIKFMAEHVKSPRFYVFSDDMNWACNNLGSSFPFIFVDHNRGKLSYEDMRLMSLCKHNIIANSSFSWWGAWLNSNPEKMVIAPKYWFSNKTNTQDLIPQGWKLL